MVYTLWVSHFGTLEKAGRWAWWWWLAWLILFIHYIYTWQHDISQDMETGFKTTATPSFSSHLRLACHFLCIIYIAPCTCMPCLTFACLMAAACSSSSPLFQGKEAGMQFLTCSSSYVYTQWVFRSSRGQAFMFPVSIFPIASWRHASVGDLWTSRQTVWLKTGWDRRWAGHGRQDKTRFWNFGDGKRKNSGTGKTQEQGWA